MSRKIFVTKYDGSREAYNQKKVLGSIVRAGVKKDEVVKILGLVEAKLYDGIPTSEIYQIIAAVHPHLYRLREALAKMGSIDFEKFVKKVLEKEGFSCQWNQIVAGFCIEHQLDIIAQNKQISKACFSQAQNKAHKLYFVEVKHHRNFHRDSGLGTVAELWARFEDLKTGFSHGRNKYNFSAAWLITNTKFSGHAKQYAKCKGLKLTGWRHTLNGTKGEGMEKMVERLANTENTEWIEALKEKACKH